MQFTVGKQTLRISTPHNHPTIQPLHYQNVTPISKLKTGLKKLNELQLEVYPFWALVKNEVLKKKVYIGALANYWLGKNICPTF